MGIVVRCAAAAALCSHGRRSFSGRSVGPAAAPSIVAAADMVHHVRAEVFGQKSDWDHFPWLDSGHVAAAERQERLRVATALCSLSVPVSLTAVQRFRFLAKFLGDERLLHSQLGRQYLLLPRKTRQLQLDVRHLRLLQRATGGCLEEQASLRRRLSTRLAAVRHAFTEARDSEWDLNEDIGRTQSTHRQPVGCLLAFLSQQLTEYAGRTVSRLDVRAALDQHPFSSSRLPTVSVLEARDMLSFLVQQKCCSVQQLLSSLYVVLYDRTLVERSLDAITAADPDTRRLDLALYDAERRCGHICSRELFGSAVFMRADDLVDPVPVSLPFPHPLASYPLLFEKRILAQDEQ